MQIAQDHVVAFHFTLSNAEGDLIDSSRGQLPFIYLHGHGNLVSGLEQALEGHQKGDSLEVIVPPELGYGDPDPGLIQTLPRAMLPADAEIAVGMTLQADTDDGPLPVRITARVAPGVVSVPWGWWTGAYGDGTGLGVNALTTDASTGWGGGVAYWSTRVAVAAASMRASSSR